MKLLARSFFLGLLFLSTAVSAENNQPLSCVSFVAGLCVGGDGLACITKGSGDTSYWIRSFDMRRSAANYFAAALRNRFPRIRHAPGLFALSEIEKDISAAPQSGVGDSNYWFGVTGVQDLWYARVGAKIQTLFSYLKENIGSEGFDTLSFLEGLEISLLVVSTDGPTASADTETWMRQFVLKRNMANEIAERIVELANLVPDSVVRLEVQNLATDIRNAPQSGEGGAQYWADMTVAQTKAYVSVLNKLAALVKVVTEKNH